MKNNLVTKAFLLFLVLSQFNLEVRAEDTKLPTKKNPTLSYKFQYGPAGLDNIKIEYNTVEEKESRDKIIPSLSDNPSCRSIRDPIINLCSQKVKPNGIEKTAYKVDPKEESKLSVEIKKLVHFTLNTKLDDNGSSPDCKNKLKNYSKIVDSPKFEEFLRSIHSNGYIGVNLLITSSTKHYEKIFSFFENFNSGDKCHVYFETTELYVKLIQLKDIQDLNKNLVDMYRFGNASPCESLRIDYDSEGNLSGIKVVKRNPQVEERKTYNIEIKKFDEYDSKKVASAKESNLCLPHMTMEKNNKEISLSDRTQTEFDKELSVILNRAKTGVSTEIMSTPADNRRAPQNPEVDAKK